MKQRDLALKAALKSKLPHDKRKFQYLRNKVVKELRQAKANYFIKLIEDSKGNSKLIWKNIDKITKKENKSVQNWIIRDQSKLIEDKEKIATIFNSFFLNSVQCLARKFGARSGVLEPINNETPVFTNENVSESIVLKIIDNLKGSRSKDVYDTDAQFFKTYKSIFCKPLTHLINLSITNSYFPNCWKAAVVTPIFKADDRTLTSNDRPISILPIASKIAERVVCDQLVSYLNESEVNLHPMQSGFRKNYSTETANCYFVEQIRSQLDKGGVVGAVFLDLAKAFDTVNHNCLMSKLQNFNLSDAALMWMKSYLSNRSQCTRVADKCSSFASCPMEVPQGSILGPILFSIYINDLPQVCPGVNVIMYADDTVLFTHAGTKELVANKLSSAMVKISNWLNESCLSLNVSKTVCTYFTARKQNSVNPDIIFNGEAIKFVTHVKYLGIIIDQHISFKK